MIDYRNTALAIVVTALSLVATSAWATPAPQSKFATEIGNCSALPLSQRGICKEQALSQAVRATPPAPTSAAEKVRIEAANERYAHVMATCKRLPISQLNTCLDKANAVRGEEGQPLSAAQQAALHSADERYRAAIQSCDRLPLSERYTCASQHGNDEWLSHRG